MRINCGWWFSSVYKSPILWGFWTVIHEVTHSTTGEAKLIRGVGFFRRVRGGWGLSVGVFGWGILFVSEGSRWGEERAVTLDITHFFAMRTRGRHPGVFNINSDKSSIGPSYFHLRREWNGSINLHSDMGNADAYQT